MMQANDAPVNRLFTVYMGDAGSFAPPVKVMAPNEHSARQRALCMQYYSQTVTDVEVKPASKD